MKRTIKLLSIFILSLILYSCSSIIEDNNEYQVTFDVFDNLETIEKQTVIGGNLIKEPEDPEVFGYDFLHWEYENLNRPWRFDRDVVISDMTLTAVFERKELSSSFIYNESYKITDGSILLEFELYFNNEKVELKDNVEKITIIDGNDNEKIYDYNNEGYIYHDVLNKDAYVYKIDTLDNLTYMAFMHVDKYYLNADVKRTNNEAFELDSNYYEEYEFLSEDNEVNLLKEDNLNIYLSNENNNYSFNEFENIINSKYFIQNIENKDLKYKFFIENNNKQIYLVDFNYIQNEYFEITKSENIELNITNTNKVLKDTLITVDILLDEDKLVNEFKINGINLLDELKDLSYEFNILEDTNIFVDFKYIYRNVEFITEDKSFNVEVIHGKTIDIDDIPNKEISGLEFINWYLDDSVFDFNEPIYNDLKIEAKYILNTSILEDKEVTFNDSNHSLEVLEVRSDQYVLYENNRHKNAGSYTVKAFIYEEGTDILLKELEATLLINKKDIDVVFKNKSFLFDGNYHSIYIENILPNGITVTYENNNQKDIGSYEVKAIFNDTTGNYNILNEKTATLIIRELDLGVTLDDLETTYDGSSHELTLTGSLDERYRVEYVNNKHKDAGVYEVVANIIDKTTNNVVETLEATLTISKKELKLEFNDLDIKYDGNTHSVELEGDIPDDVLIDYINNDKVHPGRHKVTAVILSNNNYTVNGTLEAYINIYYEVTYHNLYDEETYKNYNTWLETHEVDTSYDDYEFKGYYLDEDFNNKLPDNLYLDDHINIYMKYDHTLDLEFKDKEVVYDGNTYSLNVSGLKDNFKVEYENNDKVNAGIYQVVANIIDTTTNNIVETLTATLTINKKELNLEFNDLDIKYDGNTHSVELEGNIPDDVLIDYINNDKVHPGRHKVIAVILSNNNYTINGTLEAYINIYYEVTYHNIYDEIVVKNYNTWLEEHNVETVFTDYEFKGYYLDESFNNKLPDNLYLDDHINIYMKYDHTLDLEFNNKEVVYDGSSHSLKVIGNYNEEDVKIEYINNDDNIYPGVYNIKALILFKSGSIQNIVLEAELKIYYEVTYKHPEKDIVVRNYNTWLEDHNINTSYEGYEFIDFYLDNNFENLVPEKYHLSGDQVIYLKFEEK